MSGSGKNKNSTDKLKINNLENKTATKNISQKKNDNPGSNESFSFKKIKFGYLIPLVFIGAVPPFINFFMLGKRTPMDTMFLFLTILSICFVSLFVLLTVRAERLNKKK